MLHRHLHGLIYSDNVCTIDLLMHEVWREVERGKRGRRNGDAFGLLHDVLLTDENDRELMLSSKAQSFEEIWFGSCVIATIGYSDDRGFTKFAGEGNASRVQ